MHCNHHQPAGPLKAYLTNQSAHWFITGLVFPILVLLVVDKGLSLFEAGLVFALYSGTTVLLELPTGGLADSIGRKKVYMVSIAVHMVAVGALLLSYDFTTVAVAALFMGAGRALSSGAMDAWFVDEFKAACPQGNLQQALAKANIFIPLGLGAGSVVGGILPITFGPVMSNVLGLSIFSANLLIVLVADLVHLTITQRIVVETVGTKRGRGIIEGFKKVPEVLSMSVSFGIRNRTVSVLLLVVLALGFGLAGLELLWQPRFSEILGSETQTWALGILAAAYFVITAVGSALVTPICTRLRGDHLLVMTILMVAMGGSIMVLSFQGTVLTFATFYLVTYMVMGMTNSPYGALYNDEVPGEHRSTMLSFQSLVAQGGGLLGSVLLGLVASFAGITAAWLMAGVVVASSALGLMYLRAGRVVRSEDGRPDDLIGS